MSDNAKAIVTRLFHKYMADPDMLSAELEFQIQQTGEGDPEMIRARLIADYIAGMTDRFAIAESNRVT